MESDTKLRNDLRRVMVVCVTSQVSGLSGGGKKFSIRGAELFWLVDIATTNELVSKRTRTAEGSDAVWPRDQNTPYSLHAATNVTNELLSHLYIKRPFRFSMTSEIRARERKNEGVLSPAHLAR